LGIAASLAGGVPVSLLDDEDGNDVIVLVAEVCDFALVAEVCDFALVAEVCDFVYVAEVCDFPAELACIVE
jgi:hypothetical protein